MRMNVIILSDSNKSLELIKLLYGDTLINVVAISDDNSEKWGKSVIMNSTIKMEIVSPGAAFELYFNKMVDKFIMPSLPEDINNRMYKILRAKKIPDKDILYAPEIIFRGKNITNTRELLCCYQERDELDTIELHVTDHCNLNCKNCSMFCGLISNEIFSDLQETQVSLLKLKEYFSHIKRIRIIGGEPLLNKELSAYLNFIHSVFPYSEIRVITNGILIHNMDEKLINAFRETEAKMIVTQYLPLMKNMDKIHEFLSKNKIQHEISEVVVEFQKIYDASGNQNSLQSFAACHWKGACATLVGKEIAPCYVPFVIHNLSHTFDLNIKKSGTLDLFDMDITREKIRTLFSTPFELCKYCAPRGITVPWELCDQQSKTNINDWSI